MKRAMALFKNQNGSALIIVLIILVVVSILLASAAFLTQTNTTMASVQEQEIESYYIARSGAELTYEVLLRESTLLNQFKRDVNPGNSIQLNYIANFDEESAEIVISSADLTNPNRRVVQITSRGTAAESTQTSKVVLSFVLENSVGLSAYGDVFWSR